MEKGCKRCDFCQGIEDENRLFLLEVRTILIITLRKSSEDITRRATAKITNSIIAIVLTRRANILDTPGNPEDRKVEWN